MVKQKRKEKAGKWQVPIQKVKQMTEAEMFQVVRSGKRQSKYKKYYFLQNPLKKSSSKIFF